MATKKKEFSIQKIIENYTKICTTLSDELVKLKRNKLPDEKKISQVANNLNSCTRVLIMLCEQEGKTKMGSAKIKKIDGKVEDTNLEKILLNIK